MTSTAAFIACTTDTDLIRRIQATGYTNYTGGGGAHNNLQPYAVGNWRIKL